MRAPQGFSARLLRCLICAFALGFAAIANAQWGSIKGVIKLDKPIPRLPPIVKQGDPSVKDAAVCAAADLPNESLLVDPQSNGLANVAIYLVNRPGAIHPDMDNRQRQAVDFQLKGCRFTPHLLIVQTGQEIHISSNDPVGHNVHPYPIKNKISREIHLDPKAILVLDYPERNPLKVGCDIHPWMEAYWLVLDHPYASVTNEAGEFEIRNLPVGDHDFRIWHEKGGILNSALKVSVKEGMNRVDPIVFSAAKFE